MRRLRQMMNKSAKGAKTSRENNEQVDGMVKAGKVDRSVG